MGGFFNTYSSILMVIFAHKAKELDSRPSAGRDGWILYVSKVLSLSVIAQISSVTESQTLAFAGHVEK